MVACHTFAGSSFAKVKKCLWDLDLQNNLLEDVNLESIRGIAGLNDNESNSCSPSYICTRIRQ